MTNYIYLLICLFILNYTNLCAQLSLKININTNQAELFLEVMQKIDSTKQKLYADKIELNKSESNILRADLISNKSFNLLIDSLLCNPIYDIISKSVKCKVDSSLYNEKEAYRQAFYNIYDKEMEITAGMNETWLNFYYSTLKNETSIIIKEIAGNIYRYERDISVLVQKFLPSRNQNIQPVELFLGFDGNRGSFNDGKIIFMEGIFDGFNNSELFLLTLAHEVHHAVYGNYLEIKYPKLNQLSENNHILKWQLNMVLEGTAQQINYNAYPSEVKELYNNKKLLKELFDEWIKLFREYADADNGKEYYQKFSDYYFNQFALQKLSEYCPDQNIRKKIISRRPSFIYYLSYNLFNTILLKGGTESIIRSIVEPESLLSDYNKYMDNFNNNPQVPEDIVKLWRKNFEEAK